jgi:hypothetical protein
VTSPRRHTPGQAASLARHNRLQRVALELASEDTVAMEFAATRRKRWARQLSERGLPLWRAQRHVAWLRTSADYRALLAELFGGAVVAGSLAASAVALFLL